MTALDIPDVSVRAHRLGRLMASADTAGVTLPPSVNTPTDPDSLWDVSFTVDAGVFTEWLYFLAPDDVATTPRGQHFVHDAPLDGVDRLRVAVFTWAAREAVA